MKSKSRNRERACRKRAFYLTIAAGLFSTGLVIVMIIILDQSAHLQM